VIVFANAEPKEEQMSMDRWDIREISPIWMRDQRRPLHGDAIARLAPEVRPAVLYKIVLLRDDKIPLN
jgi:hypothetical protein